MTKEIVAERARGRASEVFIVALRLGLTSFGGPIAHLGYFHDEYVVRRRWLDERTYADLVALCQFLPGPASSQVGMAVGLLRAGYGGALAAWAGFTLPSALALVLFAHGVDVLRGLLGSGWLHGLKVAAVAVVALAVLGMIRSLAPDRARATLAVAAAIIVLTLPSAWGQIGAIVFGGLVGLTLRQGGAAASEAILPLAVSRRAGGALLILFFMLLAGLPLLAASTSSHALHLFDAFYRAGSLVFGGGHVVLPLLQASVVPPGWVSNDVFLAAYLGAAMEPSPNGWSGATLCLVAVFLPSFLLVIGTLPFWDQLRRLPAAQALMRGVNAAVVGLLLGALYDPVWTAGISGPRDFALAILAFLLLFAWRAPPWLVVLLSALGGAAIGGS